MVRFLRHEKSVRTFEPGRAARGAAWPLRHIGRRVQAYSLSKHTRPPPHLGVSGRGAPLSPSVTVKEREGTRGRIARAATRVSLIRRFEAMGNACRAWGAIGQRGRGVGGSLNRSSQHKTPKSRTRLPTLHFRSVTQNTLRFAHFPLAEPSAYRHLPFTPSATRGHEAPRTTARAPGGNSGKKDLKSPASRVANRPKVRKARSKVCRPRSSQDARGRPAPQPNL